MSAQARLPGTMPTPAVARANLRLARSTWKEKANVVDGLENRLGAAKDEHKDAVVDLDQAEGDLLAADDGSPQDLDADKRHEKAMMRAERAEEDVRKVSSSLHLARSELKTAVGLLSAARGDLRGIRAGRRVGR